MGGYRPIPIDVRVVAATNRKLAERVKEGSFREDLFFRLNVITVNIPSLRERKEDIPLLVEEFLPRISQKLNKDVMSVSQGAIRVLKAYDWPGNVRELENVLEKSILLENDPQLSANNISLNVSKQEIITEENKSDIENNPNVLSLREVERMAIIQALKYKKNIVNAANALGVSRSTLYRKMKEYQIDDKD